MKRRRNPLMLSAAFLLALIGLALPAITVQAGPPAPIDFVITQPDGTTITVRQWGDAWQHGLETVDGYSLLLDEASGYWVYAQQQPGGQLSAALAGGQPLRAGIDAPGDLPRYARPAPLSPPDAPDQPLPESSLASAAGVESPNLLVILVSFTDQPNQFPAEVFRDRAFGPTNSIRDYFYQASGGALNYAPAAETYQNGGGSPDGVVGWLPLVNTYGETNVYHSPHIFIMVKSLTAADPYINFAGFDANSDGIVSTSELKILIVAAGCEASVYCLGVHNSLRAGRSKVSGMLDAVTLESEVVVVSEYHKSQNSEVPYPATLGPMVHEFGHLLGWPDLSDMSGYTNGVGNWSLMGRGSWNNLDGLPGSLPALPDAFLRTTKGWVTPILAEDPCFVPVETPRDAVLQIGSNPNGIDWIMNSQSGTGEYWLLENRQREGYDAGLPGAGWLLWHIDETAPSNDYYANYNRSLDENVLVALEEADGRSDLYYRQNQGDRSDPYGGLSLISHQWGPLTTPNSDYNNGEPSGYSLLIEVDGHQLFLPVAMNQMITGHVRNSTQPIVGTKIFLYYSSDSGQSYSQYAFTYSRDDGYFILTRPPIGQPNQTYFLYWENSRRDSSYLAAFYGNDATRLTKEHDYDIDIGQIFMSSPDYGISCSLPVWFIWSQRLDSPTDSYQVILVDGTLTYQAATPLLGYVHAVQIGSLPNWARNNTRYYWYLGVQTAYGYGFNEKYRTIYFTGLAGPTLDGSPLGVWVTGDTVDISPNPSLKLPRPRIQPED